ncbi:hypothetical protein AAG570_002335 [Ranatra chinensis]|uniref:Uncharacterized protein n=1 Tax=Ranatra chinensis TaxID=642074 RepID=A0ABD0Y886_9HEMI
MITFVSGPNSICPLLPHPGPPVFSIIAVRNAVNVPVILPMSPKPASKEVANPNLLQREKGFLHPSKSYNKFRCSNGNNGHCQKDPQILNNGLPSRYFKNTMDDQHFKKPSVNNDFKQPHRNGKLNFILNRFKGGNRPEGNIRRNKQSKGSFDRNEFAIVKGQNSTVHIGGLLTLPKCPNHLPDYVHRDTNDVPSCKDVLLPDIIAQGCLVIENLVTDYNIKSSGTDLIAFSRSVQDSLSSRNNVIHAEAILRQLILSFLHLSSSWKSIVSVLELPREHAYPLGSVQSLHGIFQEWQGKSKEMLDMIMASLSLIPLNYKEYICQSFTSASSSVCRKVRSSSNSRYRRKGPVFPPTKRYRSKHPGPATQFVNDSGYLATHGVNAQSGNFRNNHSYKITYPHSLNSSSSDGPATMDRSDHAYFSGSQ